MHVLCTAKFFHGIAHHTLKRWIGYGAFQNFWVLIGNHEQARHHTIGAFQNCGQFRCVQHALYRAINDQMRALQGSHNGRQVLNHIGCARRSDGCRGAQCQCGQTHFEHFGAHLLQGKPGQINIDAPRLAFSQQGDYFVWLNFAQCKSTLKSSQPTVFNLLN